MEYEQSDLLKWLRNRAILEESDATTWQLNQAADTIERLQKERDQLGAGGKVWQRTAGHLKQERDAALAENKKLNGVIGGLSAQSQDEIDRLTVTANNNAAAHAKACEDLAQARAEVERLKARLDIIPVATAAPRCKLCGVLIEDDFHNSFCSTCCAR